MNFKMEQEKEKGLVLAITMKEGKTESKMKAKGVNPFEVMGLLMSQIISVDMGIKKQKN